MRKSYCPTCGSVHAKGERCPLKPPRPKRKRKPTANDALRYEREPWRANYSDPDYQRNRQEVIRIQRGCCKHCGKIVARYDGSKWTCAGLGGEVHHKVALCDGGTNDLENLELDCKSCHALIDADRRKHER